MSLIAPAAALAGAPPSLIAAVADSNYQNDELPGVQDVAVSGNYAYTAAYYPGRVTVLDISNPASPSIVYSTPAGTPPTSLQNAESVEVAGDLLLVTSKNRNASTSSNDDGSGDSLSVFSLANPAAPSLVGTVTDSSSTNDVLFGAYDVAVSGQYAYVASQGSLAQVGQPSGPQTSTGSFCAVDLNDLAAGAQGCLLNSSLPAPWTGTNALEHATSVAVSGSYAYVTAFYANRVTTIDIANPASPQIVSSLSDSSGLGRLNNPNDITVQGAYAYVANQSNSDQLTILSLADPASPTIVGTLSDPLLAGDYRVQVHGNWAYTAAVNASAVSVIDISNPANPQLVADIQDAGHLFSASGLSLDSSGGYVIAASPFTNTASNSPYPPFPGPDSGSTDTGTISVIQLDPNPISVTISPASEPPNPTSQTSASFGFSVNDEVSTVACSLDNAPLGPCTGQTGQTYTGLSQGTHTFTVQATDAAGSTSSAGYTWTIGTGPPNSSPPSPSPPSNLSAPAILGPAVQGARLTATTGTWSGYPAIAVSHTWERCNAKGRACRPIAGASGTGYTVTAKDVGSTLRVHAVGVNSLGTVTASSPPTAVVKANPSASMSVAGRQARLRLTVTSIANGALVKTLVVTPSNGFRFSGSRAVLARGITVTGARGRHLRATIVSRRGALVITLDRAVATVSVEVGGQAIRVSSARASIDPGGRGGNVVLTIAFTGTDKMTGRSRLVLRVQ